LYAGLAGEQAAAQYANEGAMRYLGRALELTPDSDLAARARLLFAHEQAAHVLGRRDEQRRDLAFLEAMDAGLGDDRQSLLYLRHAKLAQATDDYASALASATRAAERAVCACNVEAEIRAHNEWGRILWATGDYDGARARLVHALELARASHNRLQEGHILFDLGTTCYQQTAFAEARSYLQQAEEILSQCRFLPGEANCQITSGLLAYRAGDYVAAEVSYRRALAASRAIGWRSGEAHTLTLLGNNAYDLGDYTASRDWHLQARSVAQETGYRTIEAVSLDTLGLVYYALGELDTALDCARRALQTQREVGNRRSEGYVLNHLGLIEAAQGHLEAAEAAFEAALSIRRELGQEVVALDDLAGLARLALAAGDADRALARTEEILTWLEGHSPDGIEFPALVYLTCYRVLQTAAGCDPGRLDRACRVLTQGYSLIQARAAGIQDEGQRRRFLEQVRHNRELLAAWQEMAGHDPGVTG
ncbi:MAG: tetratricopeptide repeat protein, partial [Anaerolineae bacterium]|nr:tetratricopeptide repeat protein [Anaerolineae bacterium]